MNHYQLIRLAQTLGYNGITRGGLCRGFAMMWVQAACNGQLQDFNKRLNLMAEFEDKPESLNQEINRIRNDIRLKKEISTQDKALLDIPAFFEGIYLYLNPQENNAVFNEYLIQQDATKISEYTKSQTSNAVLHRIHTTDQYSDQQLKTHLSQLAKQLQGKEGTAIIFGSSNHAVSARYLGNNEFELIDTNFEPGKTQSIAAERMTVDKLADSLKVAFQSTYNKNVMLMSTEVFSSNPELLQGMILSNNKPITKFESDALGITLLHLALAFNDVDLFNRIDFNKVDVNQLTASKECALASACFKGRNDLFQRMMKDDSLNVNPPDSDNGLPIAVALFQKQWSKAEQMIEHPTFNPRTKDNMGNNYLHSAAKQQEPEVLKIASRLLEKGVDINAKSSSGYTALHFACSKGNAALVKLLVENGADINAKSPYGYTALHFACLNGNTAMVKLLVEKGANIRELNNQGESMLHLAVRLPEMSVYLKEKGCNLPQTDLKLKDCLRGSLLYNSVQFCSIDAKKEFLFQSLRAYIKERKGNSVFMEDIMNDLGFGFSEQVKVDAANAFLIYIQDPQKNSLDKKHIPALQEGRLRNLFDFYIAYQNDFLSPNTAQKVQNFKNEYNTFIENSATKNEKVATELNLGK